MKISYNWLKDYLPIDVEPHQLSEILTQIGLEVAKLEKYISVPGGLEGLVVGKVLKCEKIPNTDHLSFTEVDLGDKVVPIVCGAPNVAEGQKVVVGLAGTTLYPYQGEPFKLKKAKIRGVRSEGMIVAEDEIGIGPDHTGIIVLPDDAKVGAPARNYFDIYEDWVFEIDLTPNRTDAISHFGVARDLYAYFRTHKPDMNIELRLPSVENFHKDIEGRKVDVEIENTEACPRYAGVTLTGIKVQPSPQWMQNRLKAVGQNPINNIVDITNYVLHEIGHPLHGFDADTIEGGKIRVKTVEPGTKFLTLHEEELTLTEKDLMICDSNGRPLVLAGIIGGMNSGVTDKTQDVFIESAFFNPTWIRKSSKRHSISSDSSYRFERGVDPNNTLWALKRAALLMKEYGDGQISSDIVDIYPEPIEPFEVELKLSYLDKLLGIKLGKDRIKEILENLEIELVHDKGDVLDMRVPTYRWDVRRPADVAEEIIRIYGFNNVPLPPVIKGVFQKREPDPEQPINLISDYLSSIGFNEVMHTSLEQEEYYKGLKQYKTEHLVRLFNPLSSDLAVMRQTLLFGGLDSIKRNINYKNTDLRLYEIGNVYFYNKDAEEFKQKYNEQKRLSLWLTGNREKPNWLTPARSSDFYLLKTYVDNIIKRFNIDFKSLDIKETENELLNYGLEYKIGDKTLVYFGSVANKLNRIFEIEQEVLFAEFDWQVILDNMNKHIQFVPPSKFPAVHRDLALLLDENIKYKQIVDLAHRTERKILRDVNIFDVYKGKNIPQGKKSYAISFTFLDENKTLTDKQVEKVMKRLMDAFINELGAQIRGVNA